MSKKIRIYESEIKRAVRRKLMERYIDEVEKMDVYQKGEIDFTKAEAGTYGIKDEKGNIKSVTVNEVDDDMDDEDFIDYDDEDREEYYPELRIPRDMPTYKTKWDMPHVKESISKVKPLNLSKKFKRKLK